MRSGIPLERLARSSKRLGRRDGRVPNGLASGSSLFAPGSQRAQTSELAAASLEEVVHLYGLRMWVEQSYKQVKHALGWSQYQAIALYSSA